MSELHAALAWLPAAPASFQAQCRALADEAGDPGATLRWLATHALDETQLNQLARAIGRAREAGRSLAPLTPLRLGLAGNATTQFCVPALIATAARHGLALECIEAEFGQAMQETVAPDSRLNRARPDVVLLALDHRGLPLAATPGDAAAAQATVGAALAQVQAMRDGVHAHGGGVCIVQTVPPPDDPLFGSFDAVAPGTLRGIVDGFNRGLAQGIAGSGDLLLDVAGLAHTVGLANWHDPTLWNLAKVPFSGTFLPLYADHVCRLLAAHKGKSRRCLILDLDNTLWGGVIGDDGLEGIVLAQGDATGEAHLSLQRAALALRARGVVLAVSSKNDDTVARRPFREHPEMLLREAHIAVFQANWNDKATNIQAIAGELALGLDAMVFVDDNPAERALVRRLLPQVAVPELPSDPALYARTLLAAGYFEAVAYSGEDRQRADFYRDNARRLELKGQAGDIGAYLESLRMVLTVAPFDAVGRTRITQLINKSNQYNLTTRRYTEAEVAALEGCADCYTLQARLADTFGDNGMISVVICRRAGDDWDVDTWLMSCRVLGRGVEQALLHELVAAARARGVRRILGTYLPTERNDLVIDHYAKLGFAEIGRDADGTTRWEWPVERDPPQRPPMQIVRP